MSGDDQAPASQGSIDPENTEHLTLGQVQEIEAKIKNGLSATEHERQQLAAAQEVCQATFRAMKGIQEHFTNIMDQLRPALIKVPEVIDQIGQWAQSFTEHLAPVMAGMIAAFHELPPKIQSALITLGKSGWYLDYTMGMSELWVLEKLLLNGKVNEVDLILTQHYEDRLPDIEGFLIAALPNREKILRSSFAAHRRGEFELSVPVLLAQSDGACLDLTGYQFFIKEAGKPQVARYVVDATSNAFSEAFFSPLANVLPINESEKGRNRMIQDQGLTTWRELNRHMVLHGESFDYGTQVNSLKAVSLINYLVGALDKTKDVPI